jgi:transposase
MKAYSMDLREKIVESVKKGVPKSEAARRFGVHRATVKRYCKRLDERGTLQAKKAPIKRDQSSMRRPRSCSLMTLRRGLGPPTPREPSFW